jgi:HAD superfamily hydrolase (TIGR01458 family)
MTRPLSGIRALLVDLEGTVYQSQRLIPGAAEALREAEARGIPHRFVTNTTSRPRSVVARELAAMGLPVEPERIFTAPRAAHARLLRLGIERCDFLVAPALLEDFPGIRDDGDAPQAVVLGDLGDGLSYDRLNRAFRHLLGGVEFLTLARNRYWRGTEGWMLDVGAVAAALEYAAGRPATLVGKPAPEFFAEALASLGVVAAEAAVVGDDLESDVGGAQAAGLKGVLVRTGKFRADEAQRSTIRPDAVLDSLAVLSSLL